jgi:DNA polymerase-1
MLITRDAVEYLFSWLADLDEVALDTETTGLDPWSGARLCGISLANPAKGYPGSFYVPFRHAGEDNIAIEILGDLLRVLEGKRWLGWNAKFDLHMLAADGYHIPLSYAGARSPVEDVMFAAHLADENEPTYALKRLADRYLGPDSSRDEEELKGRVEALAGKTPGDGWKGHIWRLSPAEVAPYAEADVELTWRMRDHYLPLLRHWRVIDPEAGRDLYDEMSRYGLMFAHMEQTGIALDRERTAALQAECEAAIVRLGEVIRAETGGLVTNPGSSAQVNRYFQRTSTRKTDLDRDLRDHPLARLLIEYRSAEKAIGSYFGKYLASVKPDGRIRPNFKLIGAYTGRLSCSEPNLMAVPRGTRDEANHVGRVKEVFHASPGYLLAELDLSQAELRIASHYGARCLLGSTDPRKRALVERDGRGGYLSPMGQILADDDADLHRATAEQIGVDRDAAKRINFSAVFGIGAQKYAQTYGVPVDEAKANLRAWNQAYPEFRQLLDVLQKKAETLGYIQLDTGRVRRYPADRVGVFDPRLGKVAIDPHAASSNFVQGTVAEVMRKAGLRFDRELRPLGVRPLLQVHDSWIVEVPEEDAIPLAYRIREAMTDFPFSPPLRSDIKLGRVWGKLEKVK